MPNGKPGDHPITDVTIHNRVVFGDPWDTVVFVQLASVKRSSTKPISASQDKTPALTPNLRIAGKAGNISIPATVNTIGAVTTVYSSRCDIRL